MPVKIDDVELSHVEEVIYGCAFERYSNMALPQLHTDRTDDYYAVYAAVETIRNFRAVAVEGDHRYHNNTPR